MTPYLIAGVAVLITAALTAWDNALGRDSALPKIYTNTRVNEKIAPIMLQLFP